MGVTGFPTKIEGEPELLNFRKPSLPIGDPKSIVVNDVFLAIIAEKTTWSHPIGMLVQAKHAVSRANDRPSNPIAISTLNELETEDLRIPFQALG
jgi:hypothetical protein